MHEAAVLPARPFDVKSVQKQPDGGTATVSGRPVLKARVNVELVVKMLAQGCGVDEELQNDVPSAAVER